MNSENAKYIERFENLIRVMNGLSEHERIKHFNMRTWGTETECGTACCAAGFCGLDPWFNEQGFKLVKCNIDKGYLEPVFGKNSSWNAIEAFFGNAHNDGEWHPVFERPNTVGQVIKAAKAQIEILRHKNEHSC